MISPTLWSDEKEVFSVHGGHLEDFVVIFNKDRYEAYYCKGHDFQHLEIWRSLSHSPTGGFTHHELIFPGNHVRLYRGKINDKERLITAAWKNAHQLGVWNFIDTPYGMIKNIIIPPKAGTGYSIVAGNPCCVFDGKEYNIFFEGRSDLVEWRIFQAVWNGKYSVDVNDVPLWDGANPSICVFNGIYHLYYSVKAGKGFKTVVRTQEVR